jgi:glycosyltransferase involved in cell wall biosynthesis
MKISYAITVCTEYEELKRLFLFLKENKRPQDEIITIFDQTNGDEKVAEFLTKYNKLPNIQFFRVFFEQDFAKFKNILIGHCEGDYVFQIDADEMPSEEFIKNLPTILEMNPDNEVYLVPRVNTVEGLTKDHILKWRWNVNEKGWVNWPDYQWRIFKKNNKIRYRNKVHEVLNGYNSFAPLPADEDYCLYHPKTIEKQEKQNQLYEQL